MKVIKVDSEAEYNGESLSGPALGLGGQPGDEEPGRLLLSPTQPSWSQGVPQLQVPHLHTHVQRQEREGWLLFRISSYERGKSCPKVRQQIHHQAPLARSWLLAHA